jgi:hypothetical protein
VRRVARNVKRWQNGDMCLRWTAAGMLEAETQFRRIIGHGDLAKLALAVERDVPATRAADARATTHSHADHDRGAGGRRNTHLRWFSHRTAVTKFHGERTSSRASW